MKITIDESKKHQAFEGIGASGAWWAQIVGGWEHTDESGVSVRDKICELLYNKEKGIGLTTYRYNIGGGSVHSGRGYFSQPARATQCFELEKGKYDFTRDANAVYIMKKCVEEGASEVVFFVNSPIERLTKNHKTHLDKHQAFRENIKKENYRDFATYCLDVTEHFLNEGVPIKYLSPINEPIWKWNGGQEGCHYKPKSCKAVFNVFAEEMQKRKGLNELMLSGCESGDIRWFNKSYTRAFLDAEKAKDRINSIDMHSYFLFAPLPFFNKRIPFLKRYKKWMDKNYPNIPIKISEWTHMQRGRDKSIDSALVMANVMYEDITLLDCTSWQHWIAVSEVNYCDGLIYINLDDKSYEMTKRFYATGNFSKYIPYCATRVEASCEDDDIKIIAFSHNDEIIIIAINNANEEKSISLPCNKACTLVVTNKNNDLKETTCNANQISLTQKSINTIIYKK